LPVFADHQERKSVVGRLEARANRASVASHYMLRRPLTRATCISSKSECVIDGGVILA